MAQNWQNQNRTTLRSPQNKSPLELEENLLPLERQETQDERSLVPAQNFQERLLSAPQRKRRHRAHFEFPADDACSQRRPSTKHHGARQQTKRLFVLSSVRPVKKKGGTGIETFQAFLFPARPFQISSVLPIVRG